MALTTDQINQLVATAFQLLGLYKTARDTFIKENPNSESQFLNDEMLIEEARRASQTTIDTVDEIRRRHGLSSTQ